MYVGAMVLPKRSRIIMEINFSIVSEIVDPTMAHESFECSDDDVKSVFYKLMQEKDLDIREKKSAIIDFISAGIETVKFSQTRSCSRLK